MEESNHINSKDILSEEYIKDYSFSGLTRIEDSFSDKEFYNCNFDKCSFNKSIFNKCRFEQCSFNHSDLSLIKMKDCEMIDIKFIETKIIGVDWTIIKYATSLEFWKSIISHSSFYGKDLRNIVIKECTAHEVDFETANLSKSDCTFTDFLNSKFKETDLSFADFSNAKNYNINPNWNKIKKAKFSIPDVYTLLQGLDIIIK